VSLRHCICTQAHKRGDALTRDAAISFARAIAAKYGIGYYYDTANGEWFAAAVKPLAKWRFVAAIDSSGWEVIEYKS
jgi:hypothetical protein